MVHRGIEGCQTCYCRLCLIQPCRRHLKNNKRKRFTKRCKIKTLAHCKLLPRAILPGSFEPSDVFWESFLSSLKTLGESLAWSRLLNCCFQAEERFLMLNVASFTDRQLSRHLGRHAMHPGNIS